MRSLLLRIGSAVLLPLLICSFAVLPAAKALADPTPPEDREDFHLFLLIGQSNMAGRGRVSAADRKPLKQILALNSEGQWEPAVDPLHFDKPKAVGVGLGRTFAAEYRKQHPNVAVGLIPCAVGGSPIKSWRPGGYHDQTKTHPYDDMVKRYRSVAGQGVIKGVLWHQGESDSNPEDAAVYEDRLTELIDRVRTLCDAPDVPFLIGQLGQFHQKPWSDSRRTVDQAHRNVVQKVPRTAFISSDGLTPKADLTHFDSASQREFGVRYAAGLKWLNGLEPTANFPPSAENPRNSEGDFVTLKDGRVLYVYTRFESGSGDHDAATLVSRISEDRGRTWSENDRLVVANEGKMNVMSVSLLRLDNGRLALFYLRKNSLTDCRPYVRFSDDEAETWSDPVEIISSAEIGYYVLNNDRVVQLSGGRLLAPVALHRNEEMPDWDGLGTITCYYSDDGGEHWQANQTLQSATGPDGNRIAAQEPGVVERQDGSVLMWIRTNAGQVYQCESWDQGVTWSPFVPMSLWSPLSPASIERIPATGDLLAVWNDHSHLKTTSNLRTPLSIAVSSDEGRSWSAAVPINSDPAGWYCYTAIDFVDDAVLLGHVAGQQSRGEALARSVLRRLTISDIYQQIRTTQIESN